MEEISFVEVIRIMLKWKWIISIITATCFVLSAVVAFFILPPVYESQTMLMISPISNATAKEAGNDFSDLVSALSQYPQMTIDTYREQVKAPAILQYLRKELGMENQPLNSIANKITVKAIDKTNLITISVRDRDPVQAAKIANLVSNRFTEFVTETNKKQAESSAKFIKEQMEEEKKNMEEASKKLEEFLSKPRRPQELKLELEGKLQKITEYKTTASQIKVDLSAAKSALAHGQSILKSTSKTIITNKTLINDELLSGIIKDKTGIQTADIAKLKLSDEQINDVYVALAESVHELELEVASLTAQSEALENEINTLQKEIENLQSELAIKQQEYDLLQHELELDKQTYDAYQAKYKEAMIKESAKIGESSIVVVSEAVEPVKPVAPKKSLVVIISSMIGFMISVCFVFIREYWEQSRKLLYQ